MSAVIEPIPEVEEPIEELSVAALWRISVEQYHAMIAAGILLDDDPVELLDGLLIKKMPKSARHVLAARLVRTSLEKVLPPGWFVGSQDPVTTDTSEPEPDATVHRGDPEDYSARHPGPAETALVVEVSDSSLSRDRGLKRRVYARAGVPFYW